MKHLPLPAILAVFCLCETALADTPPGWLNVRDHGVSGSDFSTTASTHEGSNKIVVKNVGDFEIGQEVMVSKCNIRYEDGRLFGPHETYAKQRPLDDTVQMRGYDGSSGSWDVFILDVDGENPPTFRWSDDFGRTWKDGKTPIDDKWHTLSGKTEIRFGKLDWEKGYTVTFSARDQLVSKIEKIEGDTLTLKGTANRSAQDAVVRHSDTSALQAVVNRAAKERKNVYIPVGNYRLTGPITVSKGDGIVIEGENAVHTVLDISEGTGSCIKLVDGTEVTLKNLSFIGNSGFDKRDQCGNLRTLGGTAVWGFYLKKCNAVGIRNTERVLVENCHARKMSAECFYSGGRSRTGTTKDPAHYTKAITYLRCSVVDCARNAFNNNDMAENTSVLFCRIVDVGGCTWEGASRFVKFIGNYVRNAGTVAMGNIRSRDERFEILQSGQHIVADNVFETAACYGGAAIRTAGGANQVIIRNNQFINFGSSAIDISGRAGSRELPSRNTTVTGNIIDMTAVGETAMKRIAIDVSASDTIVGDNQIYVRGQSDPQVTAIRIREPVMNLNVHDNLIQNCEAGLVSGRARTLVAEVIDTTSFIPGRGYIPMERRRSHRYRGWAMAWFVGEKPSGLSAIESFDPETLHFKLAKPLGMKPGQHFEVIPPSANWLVHSNTITSCQQPVVLDSYGSPTSILRDNIISRGGAKEVGQAIALSGEFKLIGNHISGFDEPGTVALLLEPDPAGRIYRGLYRGNIFERCSQIAKETQEGLWNAEDEAGNIFIGGEAPKVSP